MHTLVLCLALAVNICGHSIQTCEKELCVIMEHFDGKKIVLTEIEWKKRLSAKEFEILRQDGTEPPFENEYYDNEEPGTYVCAGCGLPLFESETKFDSGTGWPSFSSPISHKNISTHQDRRLETYRTSVTCSRCNGHLGHVFDDGPQPTGKRYCMNSTALDFIPK